MNSKFFLRSQVIWGLIVAALPQIDQLVATSQTLIPLLPPQVASVITIVGTTWATIGRFRNNIQPITIKPK